MPKTYELIRGAHVDVTKKRNKSGTNIAILDVDGRYEHEFPTTSRISKWLDVMEPKDLAARLSGGHYFVVEGQLIDFRDGTYAANESFVHEDRTITELMKIIGFMRADDLAIMQHRRKRDPEESPILLQKEWSKADIKCPGYQSGGEFTSRLSFTWSPFRKNVNSAFDLVRLICTNGMVGLMTFLNSKIPLLNRWDEHLDIASRQIQNRVNEVVKDRVGQMGREPASVADCLLLRSHAFDRLYSTSFREPDERTRLQNLMDACDAAKHLHHVYLTNVFEDKALAAQVPAHLTAFDVWNVATEMRTHTSDCQKSTDRALDKFANELMFDRNDSFLQSAARFKEVRAASWSSPERAFYGSH